MGTNALRRVALPEVVARIDVDLARQAAEPAGGRAAHTSCELGPVVIRRDDEEAALLLALVDEVVDAVASPVRPVLGAEIVEDEEVVTARVGRRLSFGIALAEGVEPRRHVEEERCPALVAPDDLAQDRDGEVRLPRAGLAAQKEALAEIGAGPELLRPLLADLECGARVGHRLERLEGAVVVGRGNPHARPPRVGLALLVLDLLTFAADLAVALRGELLAEEDDELGRELAPATQAGRGQRATAAGGCELGIAADEGDVEGTDRAVAVLGDDDL